MKTIITRVHATELPDAWIKRIRLPDPTRIFRVLLEEEDLPPEPGREVSEGLSPFAKRQQFLTDMANLGGDEDSDTWIKEIKEARGNVKSRESLTSS